MVNKISVFNGSEKLTDSLVYGVTNEINQIRPIVTQHIINAREFLKRFISESYNPKRKQVNRRKLLERINNLPGIQKASMPGKLIIIDQDLYDVGLNWCFGGFNPASYGLGYIILSTSKMQDEIHARDILRHELGHMFSAPGKGRTNTYEHLGLHCSNDFCVMQQKDTVPKSVVYTHQRAKKNTQTYCRQCSEDIRNFKV